MTSAASPTGATEPVAKLSESKESCERKGVWERQWNRNFWCTFYKEKTSINYMLSGFFQSMTAESSLHSSSHCLSTLESVSQLTFFLVLRLLDTSKQKMSESTKHRRGHPLDTSSSSWGHGRGHLPFVLLLLLVCFYENVKPEFLNAKTEHALIMSCSWPASADKLRICCLSLNFLWKGGKYHQVKREQVSLFGLAGHFHPAAVGQERHMGAFLLVSLFT